MEKRVEFQSEGETLVGTLFRPDGAVWPLPTVVAGGGWCYTKEIVLPHVARIVNERGVQFLGFDYQNFGESGGKRRQHLDPRLQLADYRNAVTYVQGRDDVDSDAIGAFGISYSGGHVLILAATDPRIKAVVSVVAVVDGYANMKRSHGELRFRDLEAAVQADVVARYEGAGGTLPMSTPTPHSELAVWPYPRVGEVFNQLKDTVAPLHEHWSTTESAELLMNYSVYPYLPRILDQDVMMVVAEGDNITPWDLELDVFDRIPSRSKQLEILPSISHMSLYSDEADTNIAANHASIWFAQKLGAKAASGSAASA